MGIVASLPLSPPPQPTQRPYPGVPGTRVPVAEEMTSAEAEVDLRPAFRDFTVTEAPPVALIETRVQIWLVEDTSDEVTDEEESMPRPKVPPFPEKVPSQAVAADCVPTLKVMLGSTFAATEIWSSPVMLME